jgi:LysM repeat protein
MRVCQRRRRNISVSALLVLSSLGVGACSKPDVDGPTWSLTGSRAVAPPTPVEPVRQPPVYRGGRDPATGLAIGEAARPNLPAEITPLGAVKPSAGKVQAIGVATSPSLSQVPTKTADGRAIVQVRPGDTLTSIAATHRVSIAGLMFANNLRNPTVEPGMHLVLPPR